MRIVTYKRIQEFSEKHADAEIPLRAWFTVTSSKEWKTIADIRKSFNSVDYMGNHRFVFNIKENTYRLIAIISFNASQVYIRFIGTHAEYNKIKDIQTI